MSLFSLHLSSQIIPQHFHSKILSKIFPFGIIASTWKCWESKQTLSPLLQEVLNPKNLQHNNLLTAAWLSDQLPRLGLWVPAETRVSSCMQDQIYSVVCMSWYGLCLQGPAIFMNPPTTHTSFTRPLQKKGLCLSACSIATLFNSCDIDTNPIGTGKQKTTMGER
jgi:hypothetical protein